MRLRKFAVLAAVAAGLLWGLNACKKDPNVPGPTITIKDNADSKEINEVTSIPFVLHVAVDPATKLKTLSFTFEYLEGGNTKKQEEKTLWTKENAATKDLIHRFGEDKNGQPVLDIIPASITSGTLKFMALDENGTLSTREIKLNLAGSTPPAPSTPMGAIKEGKIFHTNGVGAATFDLKNGKALKKDDAGNEIGMRYMINNSQKDKPFTPNWTSGKVGSLADYAGNGATFAKVSAGVINFAEATVEKVENIINDKKTNGELKESVSDVKKDDIYVCSHKTEIYLIKITDVNMDGNQNNKGSITFQYRAK